MQALPLVTPLPPNSVAKPLQNLQVEMTSNTQSGRQKLMEHQIVDVKEFRELFDRPSYTPHGGA
jgi:hypothetical protein